MQVVVELPGLVANPQVVRLGLHHVVEDHDVVDEDLVHAAPCLEAVQIVLAALILHVRRLAREPGAGRVEDLPFGLKQVRHGTLREPLRLQI